MSLNLKTLFGIIEVIKQMAAMNKVLKALNMKTGVRFTNSEAIRNVLVDLPLHIEVVVRKIKNQRSLDQNAYLWGVCYDILSKWNGDLPEYWHEYCKLNFNFIIMNVGIDEVRVGKSTALLTTQEFYEYVERIRFWALTEHGVKIPEPERKL